MWVRYETPGANGETRREFNARYGKSSPALPSVRDADAYLLRWFWQINSARQWNGMHPQALTFGAVLDWARCYAVAPWTEEVQVLKGMDAVYCEALTEEIVRQMESANA